MSLRIWALQKISGFCSAETVAKVALTFKDHRSVTAKTDGDERQSFEIAGHSVSVIRSPEGTSITVTEPSGTSPVLPDTADAVASQGLAEDLRRRRALQDMGSLPRGGTLHPMDFPPDGR